MAASAAKAVWGENKPSTEEPVSGRFGDTSKGEPYDAGNMGMPHLLPFLLCDVIRIFDDSSYPLLLLLLLLLPLLTAVRIEPLSANSGHQASTKDATSTHVGGNDNSNVNRNANSNVNGDVNGDVTEDAKFAKNTGTATESNDTPDNPSTNLKAVSGADDTSKAQNDTRSPEDPNTNPKSAPIDVNDSNEEGVNEAPKLDGPGPKPVAELAKEHGGDAGDSTSTIDKGKNDDNDLKPKDTENDKNENQGTGEQYVQTTGLQADGGDFDATKPGAGREADRKFLILARLMRANHSFLT